MSDKLAKDNPSDDAKDKSSDELVEDKPQFLKSIKEVDLVLPAALEEAFETRLMYRKAAINLTTKILDKATKHPENEKFRKLKGNVIKKKYINAPAVMNLLKLVGFYDKEGMLVLDSDRLGIAKHVLANLELRSEVQEEEFKNERNRAIENSKKKMSNYRATKEQKMNRARAVGDFFMVNKVPSPTGKNSKACAIKFGKKDVNVQFKSG